jgi:hypothetical protein
MVPATMCRAAMVAMLCAIATCFAVLMTTPSARADDPVPLGEVAPSTDTQLADTTDNLWGDDWLANACAGDWSWDDWYWDDVPWSEPDDLPAAEDQPVAAPPDAEAVSDAPAGDEGDAVTSDAVATDTGTMDALLTTSATTTDTTTSTTSTLTAPTMSTSGNTVSWTPISGVSSYVFVRKVPNQTPQYSIVNATSVTPPVVSGQTVNYGVRTNVTGSYWAKEVSITYPSSTTTTSSTSTAIDGPFQMGAVAGSAHQYELSFLRALGVHTARIEFGIGTPASNLAADIDAYARAGIRPLLLATFWGRTPTTAEAQNLASWAKAYGPGGTFWAGKTYPSNTAVTRIEFGNETSYAYQFSDNSSGAFAARAQSYAQRARDAVTAIRAANPNVGLLVQADNAQQGTSWVQNMFRAVPDLGSYAAGWTLHPYGPNWATRIDSTVNSTATAGSPARPIWVTEWGLSSDNGRCLSDNYGWSKCMTYAEAATTLHSVLGGMLTRYGSRLGAFFLYQAHDQYATGSSTGREAYFGALQSNGTAKGIYTTEVKGDLAVN